MTDNKIENDSFLLLTGNDDEGIASFSAAIEKSLGRPAEKEVPEKNKKNGCIFLKITPENRSCLKEMCFENKSQDSNQVESEAFTGNDLGMIVFIESLSELFHSELFQNESNRERCPVRQEEYQTVSLVKEIKTITNTENTKPPNSEGNRHLFIGCLHSGIFSKKTEERLNHLADSVIKFQIEENSGKLERRMLIIKYKGVDASGNIFKYTIERGKIQIENKKRIY
jgi:hypothetical protein